MEPSAGLLRVYPHEVTNSSQLRVSVLFYSVLILFFEIRCRPTEHPTVLPIAYSALRLRNLALA